MNQTKVYQIDCKVYIMKTISYSEAQQEITAFIDYALIQNEEYRRLHNKNCYKNYVFSGFKQIERNGCYEEGKLYTFSVRCIERKMADYFTSQLAITYTDSIKGLSCQKKLIQKCMIGKLYLLTPVVMKFKEGYWKKNHSFEEFKKRLFENGIKKYNQYSKNKMSEDFVFYNNIVLLNNKPIKTSYKNIHLLGDKIELQIADNENAQELAYFLLGSGLCELNSRGYGFANYRVM